MPVPDVEMNVIEDAAFPQILCDQITLTESTNSHIVGVVHLQHSIDVSGHVAVHAAVLETIRTPEDHIAKD